MSLPTKKNQVQGRQDFMSVHDLIQLEDVTLENVLDCLIRRYSGSLYYTFAGSMLISINPSLHRSSRESITDIKEKEFDNEDCSFEFNKSQPDNCDKNSPPPPHVYCVGQKCLKNLLLVGNDQVIIVSGDSGAGKTTVIQQLLKYFIKKNERLRQICTPNGLEKKIYFATLILESLGNASTTTNPNSSRFGRFVQLNYESANGSIVGAQIRTCLLEKQRVSKCSPNERNFHIFYYVLYGFESGLFKISDFLQGKNSESTKFNDSNWKELIPAYFLNSMKAADGEDFLLLYQSLKSIKMQEELNRVFHAIFGLMVLLNIQFIAEEEEDEDDSDYDNCSVGGPCAASYKEFIVQNINCIEVASIIFGFDVKELADVFVARRIVAGGNRRKSIFRKPCESIKECSERLAAFINYFYDTIFNHVLKKLNLMFPLLDKSDFDGCNNSYTEESTRRTLSLLDLYGFENLEMNHLEQLCINYANERLHQVYLQNLKLYREEFGKFGSYQEKSSSRLPPLELDKIENESMERMDSMNSVLFNLLNEECVLSRSSSTDIEVFQRLTLAAEQEKGKSYLLVDKVHQNECPFIVKHFASDVQYQFKGMVQKNRDYIPPEFNELFHESSNVFVKSVFYIPPTNLATPGNSFTTPASSAKQIQNTPKSRTANRRADKTILQRFKSSVDSLVNELNIDGQEIHFIKCIRPSEDLNSCRIQRSVIQKQLYSCGIVDVIKIAGNGFPIRISKAKFMSTFRAICQRYICTTKHNENKEDSLAKLVKVFGLTEIDLTFGDKQIFMTESTWNSFKRIETLILNQSSKILCKFFREIRRRKQQERVAELAFALASAQAKTIQRKSALEKDLDKCLGIGRSLSVDNSLNVSAAALSSSVGAYGDAGNDTSKANTVKKIRKSMSAFSFRHLLSFDEAMHQLIPIVQRLNLASQPHIVTKGQIHHGPVSFFTRKPALRFAQVVPKHLQSQGLIEILKCA